MDDDLVLINHKLVTVNAKHKINILKKKIQKKNLSEKNQNATTQGSSTGKRVEQKLIGKTISHTRIFSGYSIDIP